MSDEEKKFMQEFQENRERVLLGIEPIPERKPNPHKNKKWAWVKEKQGLIKTMQQLLIKTLSRVWKNFGT